MGPPLSPNPCLVYAALPHLSRTCSSSTTAQLTAQLNLNHLQGKDFPSSLTLPSRHPPNTHTHTHTLAHMHGHTLPHTLAHMHTDAHTYTPAHSPNQLPGLCPKLSLSGRQPTRHSLHPPGRAASHCTCRLWHSSKVPLFYVTCLTTTPPKPSTTPGAQWAIRAIH